jgi:hypothetical protein
MIVLRGGFDKLGLGCNFKIDRTGPRRIKFVEASIRYATASDRVAWDLDQVTE